MSEATWRRRQNPGILRGVQSWHRDGTDHRWNRKNKKSEYSSDPYWNRDSKPADHTLIEIAPSTDASALFIKLMKNWSGPKFNGFFLWSRHISPPSLYHHEIWLGHVCVILPTNTQKPNKQTHSTDRITQPAQEMRQRYVSQSGKTNCEHHWNRCIKKQADSSDRAGITGVSKPAREPTESGSPEKFVIAQKVFIFISFLFFNFRCVFAHFSSSLFWPLMSS